MPRIISKQIKVGDTVEITTTSRSGRKTVRRKVVALGQFGVGVRYDGWNPYWVGWDRRDKVKKVKPDESK